MSGDTADELEEYRQQLQQVRLALEKDAHNEKLKQLESELSELVTLYTSLDSKGKSGNNKRRHSDRDATASGATAGDQQPPDVQFKIGDQVEVKYSDGKWYHASIQTMSADRSFYTIVYSKYNETENVPLSRIRVPQRVIPSAAMQKALDASTKPIIQYESAVEKDEKRKRLKEKSAASTRLNTEQREKQNSWLQFSKKAKKSLPGVPKQSIFSTKD